jgi:hypothetical protein
VSRNSTRSPSTTATPVPLTTNSHRPAPLWRLSDPPSVSPGARVNLSRLGVIVAEDDAETVAELKVFVLHGQAVWSVWANSSSSRSARSLAYA